MKQTSTISAPGEHFQTASLIKRLVVWIVGIVFVLMIPLIAMQFTAEVNWGVEDFAVMGGILLSLALAYELIARRSKVTKYRAAFAVGLVGAFLLCWVNAAVGIIGNEGQSANLLYGAVFVIGVVGSLLARFKSRGMAYTMWAMTLGLLLVPVFEG